MKSGLEKRRAQRRQAGVRKNRGASAPSVLAMYDIAIHADGKKWQPAASEPVQVTVELDEPVPAANADSLGVVHLADDGMVEELESSRYGFTFNADKTAVTAFWFSATGFSVYAIIDSSGTLVTPRRFYHFYDHPSSIEGSQAVQTFPYRYMDQSNEVVNVQIVKDGDSLLEPPIPPDVVDVNSNLVSTFEGWYVVQTNAHTTMHGLDVAEGKLDSTTVPFEFVWPTGVTGNRLAFTNAVSFAEGETGDTDYFVVPLYEHSRFVQFYESAKADMDVGSVVRIVGRRLVVLNDETHSMRIKVSDVTAPLRNSRGEYFSGWEYYRHRTDAKPTQILTYSAQGVAQEAFLEVDDSLFEENRTEENGGHTIPMWPVYVEAHFLSFSPALPKGSGATYVGSLFVKSDTDIRSVETSARPGYDFGGWWTGTDLNAIDDDPDNDGIPNVVYGQQVTDASGNMIANLSSLTNHLGETVASTDANGKITLAADVTLYAKWIPQANATYRVIIWQQKVTDAKNAESKTYDYVTHYTSDRINSENAITESMLRSFSGTNSLKSHVSGLNVLSASALNGRSEVEAAGVSFTGFETTAEWAATNLEANGHIKSDNSTVVSVYFNRKLVTLRFTAGSTTTDMTGLYGQTLAENGYTWPTGYAWLYTDPSGRSITMTFMDGFLSDNGVDLVTFTGKSQSSSGNTINFFKQNIDGTYPDTPANTVRSSGGSFYISDKYAGFHAAKYKNGSSSEVQLGEPDSNGDYAKVTPSNPLNVYFARNTYAFTFRDADTGEDVFATNMMYEASLAGLNLAHTDARIDWHGRDTEHYTFGGWYEDASCTVAFDFASGKMGTAPKTVYAKWNPVKYKVIIDPNGGELHGDDSTWFYIDYNELVNEYVPTRNFRLDMSGAYYYSYHPYNELGDKHVTPTDSAEFIPNISRRAYYTTNVDEATDTFNRYAYEEGAYRFMGWYEVKEDGTLDSAPFAFGTRHNRPLEIRALWQRSGLYVIKYESIDPAGEHPTEIWYDPENGTGGYISEGVTTLSKDPTNYDREEYIWEGWQVVDPRQNNLPLTNIRSPGDVYIVHASHADSDNVIHMRAVYSRKGSGSSSHVPDVVDLVLDSNDGAGLVPGFLVDPALSGVGTYTGGTAGNISGLNAGIWFAGRQNNFSVNLADYSPAFAHSEGFLLLGWDTNRVSTTGIPAYYANETIGIDKSTSQENVLYAVWEPQIYIDITNATDTALTGITLYIPGWIDGKVYKLESLADIYHRSEFTAFQNGSATISLAPGENLRLVIPDGYHKDFTVSGSSPYTESATTGTKLIVTRTTPEIDGETHDADYVAVAYAGENYTVSGTMHVSPTPVQVRFEKATYQTTTTVPVRYFLHDPEGTVTEITGVSGDWDTLPLSSFPVSAATNDIAKTLRMDANRGVHYYLADEIEGLYGYTTIGIGAVEGPFNEYRTITKGEPEGGSYLRFHNEKLLWSRYGIVWNEYVDSAVYVVFYKRIPVHVTVAKNVIGTEEDTDRDFVFTAEFTPHSKTIEYTKTTTFRKTRTEQRERGWFGWGNWETVSEDKAYVPFGAVETNLLPTAYATDQNLFPVRPPETFSLKDAERHPLTVYFASSETGTADDTSPVKETYGSEQNENILGTKKSRIVTMTYTQTETFRVRYQYETVKITEAAVEDFVLTSIAGDPDNELVNHNGTANIAERSYTISSWRGPDASGFYTHQLLDTAIFHNRRKTGSVTVTKAVEGGSGDESFTFRLTLGETVVDKDGYVPPEGVHLGPYGKVFTFSLANGGSVTLPGLPVGATYAVEEISDPLFVSETPANASGTVAEGVTTVAFTNTRKTDLLIQMKSRELPFNGGEQTGSEIHEVTGTGGPVDAASYTVTGLKAGHVLTVEHHVPARGTAVGTYSGHFENARFTVHDANGADVTGGYLVTATPSSLTIVPAQLVVTIVGNTETRTYSGEEQAVEGYTYTVVRKSDSAPVSDDEVHPVIEPAYSKAKGTDVGTYYMSLLGGAAVGFVKDDGYQIAPADIHIVNGSLTITPAAATVTADGKAKILGMADPALTATVTGLCGTDTPGMISYTISRDAGETAGSYTLRVVGAAAQGNYTVSFVPGTLTIQEVAVVQRATGAELPVKVAITAQMLSDLGIDASSEHLPELVDNYLNQIDVNGLRRWENLVTGTAANQLLLSTATSANSRQTAIRMVNDPVGMVDLGYTVLHELRRKVGSGWNRVDGPKVGLNPTLTLDLLNEQGQPRNASGFYRAVTMLVPNHALSITNEIPCTNIIGVLEITSGQKHTMTAVPWNALGYDPAENRPVPVSGLLRDGDLSAGDVINAMNASGTYERWTLEAVEETAGDAVAMVVNSWKEAAATIKSGEDGASIVSETPKASSRDLSRDKVVWVTRNTDTTRPYFLVGQYSDEPIEVTISGMTGTTKKGTMVPNPNLTAKSINSYGWGASPDAGDVITIPGGANLQWDGKNKVWYRSVMERDPSSNRPVRRTITDDAIPAGQGFWYYRKGGTPFTFTITPQKVDD